MMVTSLSSPDRKLYRWQFDALVSWVRCGRRGVIEAVTGSGKTEVAIAAASDALRRGRFVLVLVPSRVLMQQWHAALRATLPDVRIGRLGDNGRETAETCDVLVATRHSAAAYKPIPPSAAGGLLIADECHGLGGTTLRRALLPEYEERLGLTATLERSDDAVAELLLPFFGGVCYRYGFEQAIADGVCARPRVAFVGVPLSGEERAEYVEVEHRLVRARQHLRGVRDMPLEPFGDFLAAVAHLAERDGGADGRAARDYLDAFSKRRQIVAQSTGKYDLLGSLAAGDQGRGRRARVHRDRARRESRDQPARSARRGGTDHGFHPAGATARDPRRSPGPHARCRCRASRARRGHRCAGRQPRRRDEREPDPTADDPANGPHPAPKAQRRRRALRDHVRQGHAGGPEQPIRT